MWRSTSNIDSENNIGKFIADGITNLWHDLSNFIGEIVEKITSEEELDEYYRVEELYE